MRKVFSPAQSHADGRDRRPPLPTRVFYDANAHAHNDDDVEDNDLQDVDDEDVDDNDDGDDDMMMTMVTLGRSMWKWKRRWWMEVACDS